MEALGQMKRQMENRMMNVGSTKMMGEGMEHPRISSNQMLTICSLHNSIDNNINANHAKRLTGMSTDGSSEGQPMRTQ
jgi:hypothetical protein